jgi:hypothetical protein
MSCSTLNRSPCALAAGSSLASWDNAASSSCSAAIAASSRLTITSGNIHASVASTLCASVNDTIGFSALKSCAQILRRSLNIAVVLNQVFHHGCTLRCQAIHDFTSALPTVMGVSPIGELLRLRLGTPRSSRRRTLPSSHSQWTSTSPDAWPLSAALSRGSGFVP